MPFQDRPAWVPLFLRSKEILGYRGARPLHRFPTFTHWHHVALMWRLGGSNYVQENYCKMGRCNYVPKRECNCSQPGPGAQPEPASHSSQPAMTTMTGGQSPGSSAAPSRLP